MRTLTHRTLNPSEQLRTRARGGARAARSRSPRHEICCAA